MKQVKHNGWLDPLTVNGVAAEPTESQLMYMLASLRASKLPEDRRTAEERFEHEFRALALAE